MIAIKLRETDRKKKFLLRSYTSASGSRYIAGDENAPSVFSIINPQLDAASEDFAKKEVEELRAIPQFLVVEIENMLELKEIISDEMERRAASGSPAVRAKISELYTPKKTVDVDSLLTPVSISDEKKAAAVLPIVITDDADEDTENTDLAGTEPNSDAKQKQAEKRLSDAMFKIRAPKRGK